MIEFKHKPVMLSECIEGLNICPNGKYLDCTVGGGGHSVQIAKRLDNGKLLCLDKDLTALEVAKERLSSFGDKVNFFHTDFKNFQQAKSFFKIDAFEGILIDLGMSSYQIDNAERGFSYMQDAKLDMRMDCTQKDRKSTRLTPVTT